MVQFQGKWNPSILLFLLFLPSSRSFSQGTSRSLSTPPCGALWSWWALLPARSSSCFSSSSSFSLSSITTSVSTTTARDWTWRTPHARCVSPKTRRSRILSTISPRQGLAQVLGSPGPVFVGPHNWFPAGERVYEEGRACCVESFGFVILLIWSLTCNKR